MESLQSKQENLETDLAKRSILTSRYDLVKFHFRYVEFITVNHKNLIN